MIINSACGHTFLLHNNTVYKTNRSLCELNQLNHPPGYRSYENICLFEEKQRRRKKTTNTRNFLLQNVAKYELFMIIECYNTNFFEKILYFSQLRVLRVQELFLSTFLMIKTAKNFSHIVVDSAKNKIKSYPGIVNRKTKVKSFYILFLTHTQ